MFEDNNKRKKKRGLLILLTVCIAALGLIYFLPSDEPTIAKNHLKQASQAQDTIAKLKDKIDEIGLDILTSENYTKALRTESDGNSAFADGEYIKALPFYNSAIDLYQEAINTAVSEKIASPSPPLESEPEPITTKNNGESDSPPVSNNKVQELKQELESFKNRMIQAKGTAVAVNAENLAPNAWQNARRKEVEGDRRYYSSSENETSIKANMKDYEEAKKYYDQAANEARQIKVAGDIKAADEAKAQLRKKANDARTAMEGSEGRVPGSSATKQANDLFRKANDKKKEGKNSLSSERYQNAIVFFQEAQKLYDAAAIKIKLEQDALNASNQKRPDTPQPQPQPPCGINRRTSEKNIQNLIDRLELGLETEDIAEVVRLKEVKELWSNLFKDVKDIQVKINNYKKNIYLEQDKASYSFTINMSYYIKLNKKEAESSFIRYWELVCDNGNWKVVSSR